VAERKGGIPRTWRLRRTASCLLVVLMTALALAVVLKAPSSAAGTPLVGTFTIAAGSCQGGPVSGTYLQMVLSGGSNAAGRYFSNSDSTCRDNSITPLAPGVAATATAIPPTLGNLVPSR